MEFLSEYGVFLAKVVTLVAAVLVLVMAGAALGGRARRPDRGHLEITHVNRRLEDMAEAITHATLDKHDLKAILKGRKKEKKKSDKRQKAEAAGKEPGEIIKSNRKKHAYVVDFHGDIKASGVDNLREEITAILAAANDEDEVVIRLESAGGIVHGYGLAASQLDRIRQRKLPLTICVDKVAASGGYMMGCIADRLIAAPFAILGSIGVVAQLPNFNRLLKKHDIDLELHTAGEFKRTLTLFGENTDSGRKKFQEDIEDIHALFKDFVGEHRPKLDLDAVANGETWFGRRALDLGLVDELATSDEYLSDLAETAEVYEVKYVRKTRIQEKIGLGVSQGIERAVLKTLERLDSGRYHL